ncbi:MAG: Maf family protein [Acidimicrobiia bacterium]
MPPARRLVLASASPARLRLLRHAGFDPEVVVSGIDEEAVRGTGSGPGAVALARAEAKAEAVAARPDVAGAVVVGCDSVLDVDGEAFGKPATVDEARLRLGRLGGRSAVLCTGHCVIDSAGGRRSSATAATEVRFSPITAAELEAYLRTGEPLQVAGSFTLDGWFAPFVDGIAGDHGNVIGLSLPLLRRLLADVGLTVMDLWREPSAHPTR